MTEATGTHRGDEGMAPLAGVTGSEGDEPPINITQLVFSWPRQAQYSCEPETCQGWAIEDYDFEMSGVALAVGDVRSWEGHQWTVTQVEDYAPSDGSDHAFNVAVLTLDGQVPQRDPWEGTGQRLMYVCLSPDDVLFGIPEHPEALPEVGNEVHGMPGWIASTVREFEPSASSTYDQVLVFWCASAVLDRPNPIAA
jgi:hypothetical protein